MHLVRALGLNVTKLKEAAEVLGRSIPEIRGNGFSEAKDDGECPNIVFAAAELLRLWLPIQAGLLDSTAFGLQLKTASLAMCSGAGGWDDYLLQHCDPPVLVDGAREA